MIVAQSLSTGGIGYQPVPAGNLPAALSCISPLPLFFLYTFSFLISIGQLVQVSPSKSSHSRTPRGRVADWHGGSPPGQNRKPRQGNASVFRHPPGLNPKSRRRLAFIAPQTIVPVMFVQSKIKNLKSKIIEIYP
jgi:hypothetical protein